MNDENENENDEHDSEKTESERDMCSDLVNIDINEKMLNIAHKLRD